MVQQLRRTLLPLVNADRFTIASTLGTPQSPPGRKNGGLADACSKTGVKLNSLYSDLRKVIVKIKAAAGDASGVAVDDFFAGDNAPDYLPEAPSFLTGQLPSTTSLAGFRAFSLTFTNPLEVTLTPNNGMYTGTIEPTNATAGIKIDPRPRTSTNADTFVDDTVTAYVVSVDGANVSVQPQRKLAGDGAPQKFILRYTRAQSSDEQAAEAFVRKHDRLMATLPHYLEDLARAKL